MTTTSLMASAICTPSCSFICRRISLSASSSSSISVPQVQIRFSSWNGLKQLSISKSYYSQQIGRSKKQKGKGVYASLFGVGAPEALVIGVVALLVFGPKGLAEVARNLGKTLRAFQPTIRELQDVSREFKSTLEREIGFDDIKGSGQDTFRSSTTTTTVSPSSDAGSKDSNAKVDPMVDGSPTPSTVSTREDEMEKLMRIVAAEKQAERDMASLTESQPEPQNESQDTSSSTERAYSSEDLLKITEQQLKAAAQQQSETTSPQQSPSNTQNKSHDTIQEAASVIPSSHKAENEA